MVRIDISKGALIILGMFICLAALTPDVHAQQQAPHVVQAAVDGLHNAHHAEQASLILREQRGVLMVRFDQHTRNMMLHVEPDLVIERGTINAFLQGTGITVRCLRREPVGSSPFRHVNADNCADVAPTSR